MNKLTFEVIQSHYEPLKNESNRVQMERYMKNQFSFLGIKKTETAPIFKQLVKAYAIEDKVHLKSLVSQLFEAPFREYHYFAMMLLNRYEKMFDASDLPYLQQLIQTNSWWDSIDTISPNIVGQIVLRDRTCESVMLQWVKSDDMWLRRAGLLHQLKYKSQMNEALLTEMILLLKDEQAFFIRKAIGWVLREYSKTNAIFVKDFVEHYQLSNLSHKEALKWLKNKNA